MTDQPERSQMLDRVKEKITGPREQSHGDPSVQFAKTAKLWNEYLHVVSISPQDVCMMMALLKISRSRSGDPDSIDHYEDIAGYAALAAELIRGSKVTGPTPRPPPAPDPLGDSFKAAKPAPARGPRTFLQDQ
jgi:hypothetical protein